MASNYTENYNLCQWEPEDKVIHTEFNEDNQKIDTALGELSNQLASKVDKAALDAVAATVPKIAVGTYTGNGVQSRTIPTGFTPKAVFVNSFFGGVYDYYEGRNYYGGLTVTGGPLKWENDPQNGTVLQITTGGFIVASYTQYSNNSNTNVSGVVYHYLAIG